jgi:hypothetical protein
MAGRNSAVFGIYRDVSQVQQGVGSLISDGFRHEDVSVLLPETVGTKDFAHEKHTKAPEGATTGAGTGAVLGGTLGLLAGVGALAIPGLGPFIAAGPLMGALAGIGTGGVVGGIIGALVGMGIPEYEAKRYAGLVKEGRVLVSVHCDSADWVRRAKTVLVLTGAQDISSAGEAKSNKPKARAVMQAGY